MSDGHGVITDTLPHDENVDYDDKSVLAAWKTFIGTGVVSAGTIRPEVARSWVRCRNAGLDPWSTTFPAPNNELLAQKRSEHRRMLGSALPVMKYLLAIFNSNVSLMDEDRFVYELLTPLNSYPRTLATYVCEDVQGTGNATLVFAERKPIRVDGYENFRAIVQTYSGVSAPLFITGKMVGALNINNPSEMLPEDTLGVCEQAAKIILHSYQEADPQRSSLLATARPFSPLIEHDDHPILIIDGDGMLLEANERARPLVPDIENYSYGSQSICDYLTDKSQLTSLTASSTKRALPDSLTFRHGKQKKSTVIDLLRCEHINLQDCTSQHVLVFAQQVKVTSEDRSQKLRSAQSEPVDYVGKSPAWERVTGVVRKVAPIDVNVLLLGETGTGKELVAQAIHRLSGRKGNFVAVNCGAIPRDLLASELFGYEGGAFTGARDSGAIGKFEYANGGTLFLDEIGEMPPDMQVSLLRVLQEHTVIHVGSNIPHAIDVRFIAATNLKINDAIGEGQFRADLYYRLSAIEIALPPLRERETDIPLLADYFNRMLSKTLDLTYTPFSSDVEDCLTAYAWPGNVRELRNVVEKTLIMTEGSATSVDDLPKTLVENYRRGMRQMEGAAPADTSFEIEKERINALMVKHNGNMSHVASEMGISRSTLYRHIKQIGL